MRKLQAVGEEKGDGRPSGDRRALGSIVEERSLTEDYKNLDCQGHYLKIIGVEGIALDA
jgi:hypothetical protein